MARPDPLFSIITPVYNTDLGYLTKAVESVQRQAWTDWELILVDDLSPDPRIIPLLQTFAADDPRVHVVLREANGGISEASNSGIEVARGEFIALLDHDDMLAPGALAKMATAIAKHENVDYLYSDEDKLGIDGELYDTFKKPDWSPERLRAQMYTSHLSVLRTTLVRDVGGFDSAFDGSQDHDLVLRVTERARYIHHIPDVLYHWRVHPESTASSGAAKPYTWDAGVRAVGAHLERIGSPFNAEPGPWFGTVAVRRQLDPNARVSVIIPTRGSSGVIRGEERVFVLEAVMSLLAKTRHENLEIVVVFDTATPAPVLRQLKEIAGDRLVLLEYDKPFNYSEKCNVGFLASSGDIIVLLNDDVEVISDDIVEELCAPLGEPDVGMTGAYLVYEDGGIQHAGHSYADRGYKHPYQDYSLGDPGPFCALLVDREVSGVTAACAAIRREVFAQVGGLCEDLPANFNDVELCNKLRASGYRLIWVNRAKLFHFESRTRVAEVHQWEVDLLRRRWGIPKRDAFLRTRDYTIRRKERAGLRA
jgi:glycosyltransferase involved in cell wall biosynthesis